MAHRAIPAILIGRQVSMGKVVADSLQPEVEVLHFIASPETAKKDLPLLLQNKVPSHPSDGDIGSQDYSKPAEAILLGLGYTNDMVDEIRATCAGVGKGVPWLAGGFGRKEFEEKLRTNPPPPAEEHAPMSAQKIKRVLDRISKEGKARTDGLYYWYEK